MIDEEQQDSAIAFVLGAMDAEDAQRFVSACEQDPELRSFAAELQEDIAALALSVSAKTPPPAVLGRVLQAVRHDQKIVRGNFLPWALAASLAVACTQLAFDQFRLRRELTVLRQKDALSQVRIATLAAQTEGYSRTVAVIVWDGQSQRGILDLAKLPPVAADKAYQLWVLDPRQAAPVSAGLIKVESGVGRSDFRPVQRVSGQGKFAISIEPSGGSTAPRGEVILVSN